jgi:hypothetical protein
VRFEENARSEDTFVVQPTCPPVNKHLMELLIMMDALRRASAGRITAAILYYGYATTATRIRSALSDPEATRRAENIEQTPPPHQVQSRTRRGFQPASCPFCHQPLAQFACLECAAQPPFKGHRLSRNP